MYQISPYKYNLYSGYRGLAKLAESQQLKMWNERVQTGDPSPTPENARSVTGAN